MVPELIIEEVSGNMGRKEIEENTAVVMLQIVHLFLLFVCLQVGTFGGYNPTCD